MRSIYLIDWESFKEKQKDESLYSHRHHYHHGPLRKGRDEARTKSAALILQVLIPPASIV
jgi:hypothetical protein